MKPDTQKYISYKVEQHGRRWAIMGIWLAGGGAEPYMLEGDTVWEGVDGGEEEIAKAECAKRMRALARKAICHYEAYKNTHV